MLRLNRLTDYAMLIMAEMSADDKGEFLFSTKYLSKKTSLSCATVAKLLKLLSKKGLLNSFRGINGGYQLTRNADDVRVLDIIIAIEGNISLTVCSSKLECQLHNNCGSRVGWQKLNNLFLQTFKQISLQDLIASNINFSLIKN
jgi:FeS assembly SUF system regulator